MMMVMLIMMIMMIMIAAMLTTTAMMKGLMIDILRHRLTQHTHSRGNGTTHYHGRHIDTAV